MFYTNDPDLIESGKIELLEEGKEYFCPYIKIPERLDEDRQPIELFTIMPYNSCQYAKPFKILIFKAYYP